MDRLTSTHVPDRPRPGLRLPLAAATLGIVLAACTSAASSTAPGSAASGTTATSPVGSTEGGGTAAGSAAEGFEGSLTSSGLYSATWTVSPDQEVTPFTVGVSLVSDKGTFGNISVSPEGNVSFGSGAPELSKYGIQFTGTGAMVTLDPNEITGNRFVCAFTVDTDLKSGDGSGMLHLAGSLAVHWHPSGLGGINCP